MLETGSSPRSANTFFATSVALIARGIPQYTAECSNASAISTGVRPTFNAALMWTSADRSS